MSGFRQLLRFRLNFGALTGQLTECAYYSPDLLLPVAGALPFGIDSKGASTLGLY